MREWRTNDDIHEMHRKAISEGVIQHGLALSRAHGGYAEPLACMLI